ncbi:hypothetical protein THRCLA_20292 [Thraustotheca clavata]|uniref:Uncharacterized protein n=1 Tax=Thraustotheca clavata TaxID=74557 RepID=A0A1W0A913_9STRA|nr:hypothetical protein THRCLA_20292 [Thraustotheca clavata]
MCKLMMRERKAIEILLSLEAFKVFLGFASLPYEKDLNAIQLEAVRCIFNTIYIRPEFISQLLDASLYKSLFELTQVSQSFEYHTLLWKCLLASFEQPKAITFVIVECNVYDVILKTAHCCIATFDFLCNPNMMALVVELIKAMFVITSHHKDASIAAEWPTIDKIMLMLTSILQQPNANLTMDMKLQTVNCLLVMQHPAYIENFVELGVCKHLVTLLEVTADLSGISMSPPRNTRNDLRDGLLSFMTSLNTDLKRCVSEFLFTLCQKNPLEFTQRTGMGNAVALLRMKGLV